MNRTRARFHYFFTGNAPEFKQTQTRFSQFEIGHWLRSKRNGFSLFPSRAIRHVCVCTRKNVFHCAGTSTSVRRR